MEARAGIEPPRIATAIQEPKCYAGLGSAFVEARAGIEPPRIATAIREPKGYAGLEARLWRPEPESNRPGLPRQSGNLNVTPVWEARLWRPEPESNRRARICSPLRHHSAIGPSVVQLRKHYLRRHVVRPPNADSRSKSSDRAPMQGCI